MGITVEVTKSSQRAVSRELRRYGVDATAAEERALNAAAIDVTRNAKQLVPVDTGRLRSSIREVFATTGNLTAWVYTNVKYAPYVEYGTSRMGAQPFLTPAAELGNRKLVRLSKAALRAAARKNGLRTGF